MRSPTSSAATSSVAAIGSASTGVRTSVPAATAWIVITTARR
jgi:hypothetical protein